MLIPVTERGTLSEVARDARGTMAVISPAPLPYSPMRTYFLYRIDPATQMYAGVLTRVRVANDAQADATAVDQITGWLATQWVRALKRARASAHASAEQVTG